MMTIGIYCIKNKINKKEYIGQSINIERRIQEYKSRVFNPNDWSYNSIINQAIRKYGLDNFEFLILEQCSIEQLDDREKFYIKKRNSIYKNGYNILNGGSKARISNQNFCECGNLKTLGAKQCMDCYRKNQNREDITVDFNLIEKCLNTSMEQVAKELGYKSGNSLKKLLLKYNLPNTKEKMFQYYEEQTGKKHFKILEKEQKAKQKKENSEKIVPKKVHQYTLEGVYLKSFNSMNQAGKECNISSGHISEATRGKRKTAGGYLWKLDKME